MLPVISLCILAFALSLDGFGVGAMYGLRKIRIPLPSILLISLCSGVVIFTSMQIGSMLAGILSPSIAKSIGAFILMGIGIWAVSRISRQRSREEASASGGETAPPVESLNDRPVKKREILHIELKKFGLVIQILKTPSAADVDASGTISLSEAALLGIALSLDSFGAGIGAALLGFAPLLTASVIAFSCGLFITAGLRIGFFYSKLHWIRKVTFLPGCVLILIGIMKLL